MNTHLFEDFILIHFKATLAISFSTNVYTSKLKNLDYPAFFITQ
jgi:hypothetical protein